MVTVPKSGTLDTGSLSTASGLIAPVTKDREDVVYSDQYIDRQRKKDLERNNLPDLEFTDSQRRQMFLNKPDRDPALQARKEHRVRQGMVSQGAWPTGHSIRQGVVEQS